MTMAYDDLPAGRLRDAVRRAVARGEGVPVGRPAARARSARIGESARARRRYLCGTCEDHAESSYKAAERHADEHGGARIDLDLEAG